MSHLYLIDFDRTLFNTTAFGRDLLTALVTHFHLDPAEFHRQMSQYVLPNEVGYDFFAHATAVTGLSAQAVTQLVTPHLSQSDYTYPDVAAWASRHPDDQLAVITVGTPAYQGLKFQYAPTLAAWRKLVVDQNKGKLISAALNGAAPLPQLDLGSFDHITVLDDNPLTFSELGAHAHVTSVYVSRPGEKYAGQSVPSTVHTITSLGELA